MVELESRWIGINVSLRLALKIEMPKSLKNLYFATGLLALIFVIGVFGFRMLEGYRLLDAAYMTVITMSTVGFGTIGELGDGGKLFAIFLIISSAGIFLYAISTITTFIVEGEVRQLLTQFRVDKKVAQLEDHIILCGLGRNGREAASELIKQQQRFVAIEEDEEVIKDFVELHPTLLFIVGDATHEEVLEKANIHHANGLITAISSDAENVFIALTARQMNSKLKIVARASQPSSISKLKRAGANQVISPNLIGGRKMVNMMIRPALVEFFDLVTGEGDDNVQIKDIDCSQYPKLIGRSLAELKIRSETGVSVIGYKRPHRPISLSPNADATIAAEDRMFVLGTIDELAAFKAAFLE